MAITTTTLNGTITASATLVTLTAFTNPQTGAIGPQTLLQFTSGERCLVTDASLTPTLQVVRGYDGTLAVAHTTGEGIQYGLNSEPLWPVAAPIIVPTTSLFNMNAQEVTQTGATGSTAATVTPSAMAFLNVTGTSGAGLNLPVPRVGDFYMVRNGTTGTCLVYSVGATINGTTGTTAVTISATGTLTAGFACATAGAWRVWPSAT